MMNGMRRFLNNATSTPIIKDHASTPSRSPSPIKERPLPPSNSTKALFIRKDRKPPPPVSGPSSAASSPTTTTPPRRKAPPLDWEEPPPPLPPQPQANGVQPVNARDALLLSLLSSEAMVDSRGYEILSAEEVEELKKVCAFLDIKFCQSLPLLGIYRDHLYLRIIPFRATRATPPQTC
jgi:Up-regulated During Septation